MVRPLLPEVIVNNVTPGHNAHAVALAKQYNMGAPIACINAMDPQWGLLGDASDEATALNALYAEALAAKLPLYLPPPPVAYGYASDLNWNSNLVSVLGAGSGRVEFRPIGTAKINVRPAIFTVTQGPRFKGFTVKGNPTAGAKGIYTGDIIAAGFRDVVVRDFTGTGAVGVHVHNATNWTERNRFGFTTDNNTIGILITCADPSLYSVEYNFWNPLRVNAFAGQVGIVSRNNCYVRGGGIHLIGNITDNGVMFSIEGTSAWDLGADIYAEQTGGTGGQAVLQAAAAFRHFRGPVDWQTLTSNELAPPNNRREGGGFEKDPLTGLVTTPIHMFLKSEGGRPPAVAMLGAAGSAAVPLAVVDPSSDNTRGRITVGTGTGTTAGQFFQVAFMDAAPSVPMDVDVNPRGSTGLSAGLGQPSVFNVTVFGFWVWVPVAPAASQPNTTYEYTYRVTL